MAEIDLLKLRNKLTNGHDLTIAECEHLKSLLDFSTGFCAELLTQIDDFCEQRSTTIEEARGAEAVAEMIRKYCKGN